MLDFTAIRDYLGEQLENVGAGVIEKVYRRTIDGTAQLPAVVIGQASLEEYLVQPCVSRWELPIHLVVDRPGTDEEQTQRVLEDLWLQLLEVLGAIVQDSYPTLGDPGVVEANLTRSDFGSLIIHGQAFPAYEITLEIHG